MAPRTVRRDRDEEMLRAQIYAFIRLATGKRSKVTEQVEKVLRQQFPAAYPRQDSTLPLSERPASRQGAGIDYGFAWRESALWMRRDYMSTLECPSDTFDQGKALTSALRRF